MTAIISRNAEASTTHLHIRECLSDPALEDQLNEEIKVQHHIPRIGPQANGRKKTVSLGLELKRELGQGDVESAGKTITKYVLGDEDVEKDEQERNLLLNTEVARAFTYHDRNGEPRKMRLKGLPGLTHSALVEHRWIHTNVPEEYKEIIRTILALHDVKEDTTVPPDVILYNILEKTKAELDNSWGGFYDIVTGAVELLTRREWFYLFDSQRLLTNRTIPLEIRLLAADAKAQDRIVNNRSLEPFTIQKKIKEIGKSLWLADYVLQNLLLFDHPLNEAVTTSKNDNLSSLYGVLTSMLSEAESHLRRKNGRQWSQKKISEWRDVVYQYISDDGFNGVSALPTKALDLRHTEVIDGTIISVYNLMFPKMNVLKRFAQENNTTPTRVMERILEKNKDAPSNFLLPADYLSGEINAKKAYNEILERQTKFKRRLERPKDQYLTLFALYKNLQAHLLHADYALVRAA